MSNSDKKLIIFDFDGVFVQSLQMCFDLNKDDNPHLSFEEYSKMSEGNFFASFQSENPTVIYNPSLTYRERYKRGLDNLSIMDGFKEVVINLKNDYQLAIVSSGSEHHIKDFLEREDILHLFDDILGYEVHKNKTVKLNQLLNKYSLVPHNTVFITDTLGDILEAHEAQVKSIGVLWGLHTQETLEKGKPETIIDHPDKIIENIKIILD